MGRLQKGFGPCTAPGELPRRVARCETAGEELAWEPQPAGFRVRAGLTHVVRPAILKLVGFVCFIASWIEKAAHVEGGRIAE
jgi:hypothetical protein